jgi:Na+/H+ antiporter NhaA
MNQSRITGFTIGITIVVLFCISSITLILMSLREGERYKINARYLSTGIGFGISAFIFLIFLLNQFHEFLRRVNVKTPTT